MDENTEADWCPYLSVQMTVANATNLAAVLNNSENHVTDRQHVD